jgi:hypothetical protein
MLGPPYWSIRNCGSTLKDVGPKCTLLREILVDVPGNPSRKRQTVALGICKTEVCAAKAT